MNIEPQNFFIGLIDFFAILLPGALLVYVFKSDVGPWVLSGAYSNLAGAEGWAAFLFCSYLLGHFVFLLGSCLLDDPVYDKIRVATYREQIKRLAEGNTLSIVLARRLAAGIIKNVSDQALRQAVKIKKHYLDPLNASAAINTFQWCKARLTLEHREALATVERFEADSKFFRSFVIVLFTLVPWGLLKHRPLLVLVSLPLLALAFWRYVDQRVKATTQAYWYVITLEACTRRLQQVPLTQTDAVSHAGGVVFKRAGGQVKYLLVQASKDRHEWVLPKGPIENGERAEETAVREVREETGVWARISKDLKSISLTVSGEPVKVQFYLMEALEEEKAADRERERAWLPLDGALCRAMHNETRDLLNLAARLHAAPGGSTQPS